MWCEEEEEEGEFKKINFYHPRFFLDLELPKFCAKNVG